MILPPIINHVGLSGGKDSTALWGWVINESGYPLDSIRGSFADTGNEYQEVYDQIATLSEYGVRHGVAPIVTLYPELDFLSLVKKKGRFPGACARFCTEHLKMVPCRNYLRYFMWVEGLDVITHSGVRAAESEERAQLDEYDFDSYVKCRVRRPLLKWTIAEVWDAHRRYGLPINPLYLKGRKRVGCRLCCMSNKEDVRLTVKHRPWVIDLYRDWERQVTESRGGKYTSFFPPDKVPERQRTATYENAKGEVWSVATIDDVARWSQTLQGGAQGGFDFMFEEDDDFDAGLTCKSTMGHCE